MIDNSSEKKVSVIIPVYNKKKYVDKCINSICKQTYSNIDIIIINDGSTDGSREICDVWKVKDNRIRVFHTENKGVGHARNYGIKEALGNYIMFVDADDLLDKNCIKIMIDSIVDDIDMVVAPIRVFRNELTKDSVTETVLLSEPGIYATQDYIQQLAKHDVHYFYNGPVSKLFKNVKPTKVWFEEKDTLGEDFVYNMKKLREIKKIMVIESPCYYYRIDSTGSLSKSKHTTEYYKKRYDIMFDEFVKTVEYYKCEKYCNIDIKKFQNKIVKLVSRNVVFDIDYNSYFKKRSALKYIRCDYINRGFLEIQKNASVEIKSAVFCIKYKMYFLLVILFYANSLVKN